MPETNPQGGFDLSSLSSVLQNEDTLRQLRQMAESMGLGAQLEGALNQMQQSTSPPVGNPNPSVQPNGRAFPTISPFSETTQTTETSAAGITVITAAWASKAATAAGITAETAMLRNKITAAMAATAATAGQSPGCLPD